MVSVFAQGFAPVLTNEGVVTKARTWESIGQCVGSSGVYSRRSPQDPEW